MPRNSQRRRPRKNVGVIGLGIIGSRVTENLRRKGFQVFVWNRTPRPVPNFVGAPAEIAEMCDHIQIFVSDDDALLQIVQGLAAALTPQHLILAHPTVAPHSMRAAADIVEQRGARFVEAPFTGSKGAAEKGELVYYVGGDEAAIRDARPILEASGKEIIEIGEIGHATAIKIATNMITAANVQAAAEALALIQSAGVPLDKFAFAMQGNASNSTTLTMKLPKIMQRDFEPHFSLKHMLKDMQIASRFGLSQHLELSVAAAARDRLLEQMQRGHGDEDYSAVARKYFGEIQPPSEKVVADLELFEKPAPVEPYPFTSHEVKAPHKEEALSPVMESAVKDLIPNSEGPAMAAPTHAAAAAHEPAPHTNGESSKPAAAAMAAEPAAEPEPEMEPEGKSRRGLLSRLLRRSEY